MRGVSGEDPALGERSKEDEDVSLSRKDLHG